MGWRDLLTPIRGLVATALLIGCGGSGVSGEPLPEDTGSHGVDTAADPCALLTWDTVGAPFATTWCTPCHASTLPPARRAGAPVGVDFDTEAAVLAQAALVRAVALGDTPTMPPVSPPERATRDRVAAWLDCATADD